MDDATSSEFVTVADVHVPIPESGGGDGGRRDVVPRRQAAAPESGRPKRELDTIAEDEIQDIGIRDQSAGSSSAVPSGSRERRKGKRPLFKKKKPKATSPGSGTKVKPSVKFTVTRVDQNEAESSRVTNGEPPTATGSHDPESGNTSAVSGGSLTVNISDGATPLSDSESSCGDTLTQSSITALLARKFKSYRTYRYDLAGKDRERSRSFSGSCSTDKAEPRPALQKRLISRYESQDYDQCENKLFMEEQEKERALKVRRKWLARWIVNLLTGIGTALVATIIEVGIEYVAHYKFWILKKLVMWCDTGWSTALPLLYWICVNCCLVFLGSCLVTFVEPQAVGSGIPQIKCYLNGVKIPGLLSLRALIAKSFGVILSVSGGLACGKEGPMIHSGAIVAAGISQGRSKMLKTDFKIFEYLRSDTERRDFVSGGAAAGVSAAFGAPVGGLLFSLEEGASFWNQSLTWRIVFASMIATFTVNVLLSAIHGHPADLSNPGLISFGRFSHITYQAIEIPIFLLMGVLGGLFGAAFNGINSKLTVFRKKYLANNWLKVIEAMLVAGISAVMGFTLIFLVNDCVPDDSQGHHDQSGVKLYCAESEHNVMSAIFFKTPEQTLIAILHDNMGSYTMLTLSLFVCLYFFLACWTYGLSVSSGIFIPCLLTGATWGRLVGMGVMYLFPTMGYDYSKHDKVSQGNSIGKYALIGAACQLGGTVRMTISLTVILLECTGDITFGLPIVMVLIIAKWVGDLFNSGLYDMHIQLMGIPLLPWEPPEMSYDITAKQVMNTPVISLRAVEEVSRIVEVLENMPHLHSGFPVVEDYDPEKDNCYQAQRATWHDRELNRTNTLCPLCNKLSRPVGIKRDILKHTAEKEAVFGRCKGLILRSQLCLLLRHKVFLNKDGEASNSGSRPSKELKLEDFRDFFNQNQTADFTLTEDEKKQLIDLTPYMNPTPYTVTMNASLPRMFRLFRGLGLRHLIAVNDKNEVVGMVTRKDLAKYRMTAKGGSLTVQELHIHHD